MNKSLVSFVLVALAALMFSGCASIPAKATSDESLIVIKTEFINPDNLPRGREISFRYSGDYPASWVGEFSWDFNLVVIREPGVMLESLGTRVQSSFTGKEWAPSVNLPLPYEAGKIVILDYVFVHKTEKTGPNSQTTGVDFRMITPQEKNDLMNALKADQRFASWME